MNGGDDDMGVVILQLSFENRRGGVAVGRAFLKAVIFLHGLVVQILSVYHKEHLVDVGKLTGQPRRLEGGQGLSAAGGVPDVAAARDGTIFLIVVGNFNAVQDPLGGGNLIGAHDHQDIFRGKNAVPGQHIQHGVLGKEGAGEVQKIGNHLIAGIRPEGGKLEAMAGLLFSGFPAGLPDGVISSGVGVILGVGAVGDDENLHILKEAAPRPEGVPLIAVDLVKGLPDGHAPALELDMYQRQAIDQNGHVVAVVMPRPLRLAYRILVDDLETVVMDVFLVNEGDILGGAVVPPEHLHKVLLDLPGLLHHMLIGVGDGVGEEPLPLAVGE